MVERREWNREFKESLKEWDNDERGCLKKDKTGSCGLGVEGKEGQEAPWIFLLG